MFDYFRWRYYINKQYREILELWRNNAWEVLISVVIIAAIVFVAYRRRDVLRRWINHHPHMLALWLCVKHRLQPDQIILLWRMSKTLGLKSALPLFVLPELYTAEIVQQAMIDHRDQLFELRRRLFAPHFSNANGALQLSWSDGGSTVNASDE